MRKVLFTFLGTGHYQPCYYSYNGKNAQLTRFVQTAIYEHLLEEGPIDEIIIFATEEAKRQNLTDHQHPKSNENLEGLENAFNRLVPDTKYKLVDISSSQNEEANWELFDKLIEEIQEGDEIYFDITHSFRSIPFVALIVLNYARLVKKAEIKKVVYGLFDPSKPDEPAPIVDISSMISLLDWTNGVDQFIRSGETSLINELVNKESSVVIMDKNSTKDGKQATLTLKHVASQLETVSKSFQTSRSLTVSNEIKKLQEKIVTAKELQSRNLKPLSPLLNEIEKKYKKFGDSEVLNYLLAVEWCEEHSLYQQGFTLLIENVVSAICIALGNDVKDKVFRSCVNKAITAVVRKIPKEKWKGTDDEIQIIQSIVKNIEPYRELLKVFSELTEIRNDINHGGTNKNAFKPSKFKNDLKQNIDQLRPFFMEMEKLAENRTIKI